MDNYELYAPEDHDDGWWDEDTHFYRLDDQTYDEWDDDNEYIYHDNDN